MYCMRGAEPASDESLCDAAAKPPTVQECNTQPCFSSTSSGNTYNFILWADMCSLTPGARIVKVDRIIDNDLANNWYTYDVYISGKKYMITQPPGIGATLLYINACDLPSTSGIGTIQVTKRETIQSSGSNYYYTVQNHVSWSFLQISVGVTDETLNKNLQLSPLAYKAVLGGRTYDITMYTSDGVMVLRDGHGTSPSESGTVTISAR